MEWGGTCGAAHGSPARPVHGLVARGVWRAAFRDAPRPLSRHAAVADRGEILTGLAGLSLATRPLRFHWSSQDLGRYR